MLNRSFFAGNIYIKAGLFFLILLVISVICEFLFFAAMALVGGAVVFSGAFGLSILGSLLGLLSFRYISGLLRSGDKRLTAIVTVYFELLALYLSVYFAFGRLVLADGPWWREFGEYPVFIFLFFSLLSFLIHRRDLVADGGS